MIGYIDITDGGQTKSVGGGNGPPHVALQNRRDTMSAQKITNIVDQIALTFVNIALLAALPVSAYLFITNSI